YRRNLSRDRIRYSVDGVIDEGQDAETWADAESIVLASRVALGNDEALVDADVESWIEWYTHENKPDMVAGLEAARDKYRGKSVEEVRVSTKGALYSLHLPDEMNALMLDRDALISEQSPEVQAALAAFPDAF